MKQWPENSPHCKKLHCEHSYLPEDDLCTCQCDACQGYVSKLHEQRSTSASPRKKKA